MTDKLTQARFTREPMENEQQFDEKRTGDDRRDLSPHQEDLELRLARFFTKCLAIFAVLGITNAVALFGFGIVLGKQGDLTNEVSAQNAVIQAQRFDAALSYCNETNTKNIAVNDEIDKAIAQLPPEQRVPAEKQSKPFRLILSAAVPLTLDCYAYAEARVQGKT